MSSIRVKRVAGRREQENVLRDIDILQDTMNQLRGCGLIPRGVYRFRTHEEADEWMMRQIAANHARHASTAHRGRGKEKVGARSPDCYTPCRYGPNA